MDGVVYSKGVQFLSHLGFMLPTVLL